MEIILSKEKLNIIVDRNSKGLGLNPWGILNRIWLRSSALCPVDDADMPLHTAASMKISGSPSLNLSISRGGLCNIEIPTKVKNDFKFAFGYVLREHPTIPDKPTGKFVLHGDRSSLQKAVFSTTK